MERMVIQAFLELGGAATAYQVVKQVQLRYPDVDSNTITPRLKPLERKSLLRRTDRRGPGKNGPRRQMVWEVFHSPAARRWLALPLP